MRLGDQKRENWKWLTDEDPAGYEFATPMGGILQKAGIGSVHWSTVGATNAKDREIMAWAKENGHVVFTHDLDFTSLLAATEASGPSVIQIRTQNVLPEFIGNMVVMAIKQFEDELRKGVLISIDEQSARARVLPF